MSDSHDTIVVEIWKDVLGFEGAYSISNLGRVKSLARKVMVGGGMRQLPERILKPQNGRGYHQILMFTEGSRIQMKVHRLVLGAFVGACPDGMEAAHNNGNCTDNRLANLRWATPVENAADKELHGTLISGDQHRSSKLTEKLVKKIRSARMAGITFRDIASQFGTTHANIVSIVQRKSWQHVP